MKPHIKRENDLRNALNELAAIKNERDYAQLLLESYQSPVADEEVRDALKWADEYDPLSGSAYGPRLCTLARALRSTTAKLKEAEAKIADMMSRMTLGQQAALEKK